MKGAVVVVGAQWGDEGKGKVVDLLSAQADVVVRSQGGNNAGHTIVFDGSEFKFHVIPSGILYPHVHCYVTGGCVLDLESVIQEIKELESRGVSLKGRLHLSAFAHLVMPYHKDWDLWQEEMKGDLSIGTTRKGIGPAYADKANRIGIQLGELLDAPAFSRHLRQVAKFKNEEIVRLFQKKPIQEKDLEDRWLRYGDFLRPYISFNAEREIAEGIKKGRKVLLEGAQGSYLDLTFGTYPYVTSSSTMASGIAAGAGIGPTQIGQVIGVVKAFTTRVGMGAFPSELTEEEARAFPTNEEAREIGTTTGRNRRMGWFDVPMVRQALRWNGATSMAIMKLDILDGLSEIKICTGYRMENKDMDSPPVLHAAWERVDPIYETLPGWQESTKDVSSYGDLPEKAARYLKRLESLCECPISLISYGADRRKTILMREF